VVRKPEGKRLLGRPRSRREEHIKIGLKEIEFRVWSGQDRDRWPTVVNAKINHKMRGISWPAKRTVSFSKRTVLYGVSHIHTHTHSFSACR
jgi:hypothetical protein